MFSDKPVISDSFKAAVRQVISEAPMSHRVSALYGMGAHTKKEASVGKGVDYYHPSTGDKLGGTVTHAGASVYKVKDDDSGQEHTFRYHERKEFEEHNLHYRKGK